MVTQAMVARRRKKLISGSFAKRGWKHSAGFRVYTPRFGPAALADAQRLFANFFPGAPWTGWTTRFTAALERDQLRYRERAVTVAEREEKLGVVETRTNGGGRIDIYKQKVNGFTDSQPWCADFHAYCFLEVGDPVGFSNPRYCPNYLAAAREHRDRWRQVAKNPKRGDTVLFDWDDDGEMDHIGFITRNLLGFVRVLAGPIPTVEGNTGGDPNDPSGHGFGDGVHKRWRRTSDVGAVVRRLDHGEVLS